MILMDLSKPQNLTKDEIISEELIREIFTEEDEVSREKLIVDIQSHAKQLDCKGEFDRLIKSKRRGKSCRRSNGPLRCQTRTSGSMMPEI